MRRRLTGISFNILIHRVFAVQGKYVFLPDPVILGIIPLRLDEHDILAVDTLFILRAVHCINLQGKAGKVAHHKIKDLIDDVRINTVNFSLLQNQLPVDHDGKHFA